MDLPSDIFVLKWLDFLAPSRPRFFFSFHFPPRKERQGARSLAGLESSNSPVVSASSHPTISRRRRRRRLFRIYEGGRAETLRISHAGVMARLSALGLQRFSWKHYENKKGKKNNMLKQPQQELVCFQIEEK